MYYAFSYYYVYHFNGNSKVKNTYRELGMSTLFSIGVFLYIFLICTNDHSNLVLLPYPLRRYLKIALQRVP